MSTLCAILIGIFLSVGNVHAGTLSSGLERFLADRSDSDMVKVMLSMTEQADIASLDDRLHREHARLSRRHLLVVTALQQTATSSQAILLSDLEQMRAEGSVEGWTSHWISNLVIVKATVATVRLLAARSDVAMAEVDLVVDGIDPVYVDIENATQTSRGIQEGVDNIEADRVWYELGIFGDGVIIGGIDTGVMSSHVSFADRWQGNFAPHSHAWLDLLGNTTTPGDANGHGTFTMGTMVGASSDTIGVAPGAHWIATNPIDQDAGDELDNDIIAALEWMTDPDGDPGTLEDVPDVVQNSWRVNENYSGYYDCDSRWWDAIDNCEAAGVVLTWSAGNEGPGPTTIGSPADRADTPYNCFSIGSTLRYPPFTISSFSSRGPSGCGGPYDTKPEICAPGSDIYSSWNDGGYHTGSGTSASGPHVAGVAGLMRCANPNVDVTTIKQVLMETATDLGTPGEDNTYGWGFVNAYEAVLAVMNGATYHDHEITSEDNGNGIPDVGETVGLNIRLRNTGSGTITDATGMLSSTSPWISFNNPFSSYAPFDPGEIQVNDIPYSMEIDIDAPQIFDTELTITVTIDGSERDFSFDFSVGILERYYLFDCESGVGGWTHDSPDGWGDQWHLSTEDASSPIYSWKCGDTGIGTYENSLDARLISEQLLIQPLSQLVIQHRLNSETSGAFPDSAYDGGVVEISSDGINWEQLSGEYNKSFRWESSGGNPATHPFPGGTPCFAGSFDWREDAFDLSAWSGETVHIRFRFGTDSGTTEEGWYLDDVALWGYTAGPGGDPLFITIHFNNPYMFISWEEEPGATGYRVYRSTTPYDQFHLVQDGSINSYTTSMVGSDYFYYVTWY